MHTQKSGGYVPALSEIIAVIERTGLYVTGVEVLRLHYAETLRDFATAGICLSATMTDIASLDLAHMTLRRRAIDWRTSGEH